MYYEIIWIFHDKNQKNFPTHPAIDVAATRILIFLILSKKNESGLYTNVEGVPSQIPEFCVVEKIRTIFPSYLFIVSTQFGHLR